MKKRLFCLMLLLCLLPLPALSASSLPSLPGELTLKAGQFRLYAQGFTGVWESSDPTVAHAEIDVNDKKNVRLIGFQPGEATLTLTGSRTKKTATVHVTVLPEENPDGETPEIIQRAIQIGLEEWAALGEKAITKEPKGNKFTKWWGYACGWCGAFANYCIATAGVPMEPSDTYKKLKPTGDGAPHAIREAAVPKLDTGYTNMERTTKIPRPGYLVIYGSVKDSYGYKHVGLVTDVEDRGDGVYLVSTVEGNLSNTVKRFSYLYNSRSVNHENMEALPAQEQTEPGIQYTPHQATWYVTEFCMTWY